MGMLRLIRKNLCQGRIDQAMIPEDYVYHLCVVSLEVPVVTLSRVDVVPGPESGILYAGIYISEIPQTKATTYINLYLYRCLTVQMLVNCIPYRPGLVMPRSTNEGLYVFSIQEADMTRSTHQHFPGLR